MKTKKILLISLIFSLFISSYSYGYELKEYYSRDLSLRYPSDYKVIPPSLSSPVLIIEGESGKIEIFNRDDYISRYRQEGYLSDENIPQEILSLGLFDIWLFYKDDDQKTKQELEKIVESIYLY